MHVYLWQLRCDSGVGRRGVDVESAFGSVDGVGDYVVAC